VNRSRSLSIFQKMKTSLIIPFKNEKEYAELTMQTAYADMVGKGLDFELIAVDDSSDGTWEILEQFQRTHNNIIVIKGGNPPGYGKALRKGFSAATGDILIPFNGDLCDSLEDVDSYIKLINDGYDMVFGSRYMEGGKILGHPTAKVYLSRAGNAFLQWMFNAKCTDFTNTFKAYRREVVDAVSPQADGYDLGLELALKGIIKGYKYTTIPVVWSDRQYGISKMSILKSMLTHLKTGIKIRLTYQ
jgi:dolichol-phosphate mannosyltransferase